MTGTKPTEEHPSRDETRLLPSDKRLFLSALKRDLQDPAYLAAFMAEAIRLAGPEAVVAALEKAVDDAEVVRILRERAAAETEPLADVAFRLGVPFPESLTQED